MEKSSGSRNVRPASASSCSNSRVICTFPLNRSARHHDDLRAAAFHDLPGFYLGRLATLGLAVDGDLACGDEMLTLPTARCDARELEQIADANLLALQLEFDGFHSLRYVSDI